MTIDKRSDKEKGIQHHQADVPESESSKKNFDQKIYMFPESYNELRKELITHWPALWAQVGWPMAFAANIFVEQMNAALDLEVVLDSDRVDAACTEYLQVLCKRRGVQRH